MRKVFFKILILALGTLTAQEQYPPQLLFKHLSVNEGLSQASNSFIFKDSKGFVWISSISGLNRFDGYKVKVYREEFSDSTSIVGANVNGHFSEDKASNIWFTTFNALNCYIRKNDHFENFTLKDSSGLSVTAYFNCGQDNEGNLWIIHKKELYKFDVNQKIFSFITAIGQDFQRGKLICTPKNDTKHLYLYGGSNELEVITIKNDKKVSHRALFEGLPQSTPFLDGIINEIVADNSLIWIVNSIGLIAFNTEKKTAQFYQSFKINNDKKTPLAFTGIEKYNDNFLILSCRGHGLMFFDKKNKDFSPLQKKIEETAYSLLNNNASEIYTDKEGGIWVGISGFSVDYTSPAKIKFINYLGKRTSREAFNVRRIFELSDGNVWAGGIGNENYILDKQNKIIAIINSKTHPDLKGNSLFYRFEDAQKRVWLLGWKNLICYDLKTNKTRIVDTEIDNNKLTFIFGVSLQDGSTVFSAKEGGLFKIKETADGRFQIIPIQKLHLNTYPIFHQDKKGLIYANEDLNQMVVFNQNFEKIKQVPIAADFLSFYEPKNDAILWVGTDRGLLRYHKLKYSFRFFTEEDGLPNAMIYGIVADEKNNLWLSTNAGLARFDLETYTVKRFNVFDGISHPEFNTYSYCSRKNGDILFGSLDGITVFNPDKINFTSYSYQPLITSIKINDEDYPKLTCSKTQATNVSEIKALQLSYEENTISFEFSALDYGDAKNNQYRYKMLGEDTDWIESGTRNFVRYSNLKPDNYVFLLYAANSDGNWCELPNRLEINIIPPFWMRTWFKVMVLLLILGLFWLGIAAHYEYKHGKKLALEEQKIFWARKMHEDLGAEYSSLKLRLELFLANLKIEEGKQKEIERITNLSEKVLKKITGITWSLKFQNDYFENLIEYLQKYASEAFEDTSTDMHFPLPENLPEKVMNGESRMTILHIFKETLNNIQKSANASEVTVDVQVFSKKAKIIIKDNGKGFDPALIDESTGNGLTHMQERMLEIKGKCIIKTSPKGTSVELSFPY